MNEPSTSRDVRFGLSDRDFDERVQRLLNDGDLSESDSEIVDDSDEDPDFVPSEDESGDEQYETESSDDENELLEGREEVGTVENYLDSQPQTLRGKEGYEWTTIAPPRNRRTPAHNIIRGLSGLTAEGRALGNEPHKKEVWSLLFTDSMIDIVVRETNRKLAEVRERINENTSKYNYNPCDAIEIKALLGLFLYASIFKSGHEDMRSLFSKDATGRPIFVATMSCKRFEILISSLRFDDRSTRDQRKKEDKAAAISDLFNALISNGKRLYTPKSNVTVDEMLVPFRGKCPFKQYMPKKPAKYGIKIFCLADSGSSYLHNAFIYTGKNCYGVGLAREEQKLLKSTQVVLRLSKNLYNTNRNVTADNWFSSIELVDELRSRGLTFLGTMKKNKKEIPPEFLPQKEKRVGSSIYAFNGDTTLLSVVTKKNKAVILVSSMHHEIESNPDVHKPEIVAYYNKTKGGVDTLDMKTSIYASNRKTRRWPMTVFYAMVNIASVNAFILYLCYRGNPVLTRFEFVKQLAFELVEPHIRRRLQMPNIRADLKKTIMNVLGEKEIPGEARDDRLPKRKTCSICPYEKKRKTQYKCIECGHAICLECSRKLCLNCAK